jgi:hypothetical protein
MCKIRNAYKILARKLEGMRPLGRHGLDGDTIKMNL